MAGPGSTAQNAGSAPCLPPSAMKSLLATLPLAALLALCAGCQSMQAPSTQAGPVVALYASAAEAGAAAMGRFDTDPVLLVQARSLSASAQCAGAVPAGSLGSIGHRARCVRTPDGQQAWLPLEPEALSSLPGLPVSQLDCRV